MTPLLQAPWWCTWPSSTTEAAPPRQRMLYSSAKAALVAAAEGAGVVFARTAESTDADDLQTRAAELMVEATVVIAHMTVRGLSHGCVTPPPSVPIPVSSSTRLCTSPSLTPSSPSLYPAQKLQSQASGVDVAAAGAAQCAAEAAATAASASGASPQGMGGGGGGLHATAMQSARQGVLPSLAWGGDDAGRRHAHTEVHPWGWGWWGQQQQPRSQCHYGWWRWW